MKYEKETIPTQYKYPGRSKSEIEFYGVYHIWGTEQQIAEYQRWKKEQKGMATLIDKY